MMQEEGRLIGSGGRVGGGVGRWGGIREERAE